MAILPFDMPMYRLIDLLFYNLLNLMAIKLVKLIMLTAVIQHTTVRAITVQYCRVSAEGVSHYPCSHVYCGPNAASEPETIAVQNESRRLVSRLQGWLTMHSYGRMWMFPYGTTVRHSAGSPCERVPDHSDLVCVT